MEREPQGKKVFVIVGATNTGKTTSAKNIALNSIYGGLPLFIQDVNKQYLELKNKATPADFKIKTFLEKACKLEKHTIIFDEATFYFKPQQISEDALILLGSKRHAQNLIILNFHSLRKVPLDILDFVNFIVIHKTNDQPHKVEEKFEEWAGIYDAYTFVKDSENLHENIILKIAD